MTNESSSTTQNAAVAEQGAHVAPENPSPRKGASQKKGAPKAKQGAKQAKPTAKKAGPAKKEAKASKKAAKPERKATALRAESKGAKILEMIGRAKGATLAEIMKATGWQAHSLRGFLSTAAKKHNLKIESSKNDTGERVYKTAK